MWRARMQQAAAFVLHGLIVAAFASHWDFEKELVFYGSYHTNRYNQLIHFFFVPTIWWCLMTMFCYVPICNVPLRIVGHDITWGTSSVFFYCVYYLILDPNVGSKVFAIVLVLMYVISYNLVQRELNASNAKDPSDPAAKPSLHKRDWKVYHVCHVLHAFSWYMQIHPGHGVFEGIKPVRLNTRHTTLKVQPSQALFDSFGQSLGVGPLFAFYEGWWFFGFDAELRAHVQQGVTLHQAEMCTTGSYPWC